MGLSTGGISSKTETYYANIPVHCTIKGTKTHGGTNGGGGCTASFRSEQIVLDQTINYFTKDSGELKLFFSCSSGQNGSGNVSVTISSITNNQGIPYKLIVK